MQVLRNVPSRSNASKEVFSSLTATAPEDGLASVLGQAMRLPQDLLAKLIEAQSPVLDLRHAKLSLVQLARLSACILQSKHEAVTTMHVSAVPVLRSAWNDVAELQERSSTTRSSYTSCNKCSRYPRYKAHTANLILVGLRGPSCGQFCAAVDTPALSASAMKPEVNAFIRELYARRVAVAGQRNSSPPA